MLWIRKWGSNKLDRSHHWKAIKSMSSGSEWPTGKRCLLRGRPYYFSCGMYSLCDQSDSKRYSSSHGATHAHFSLHPEQSRQEGACPCCKCCQVSWNWLYWIGRPGPFGCFTHGSNTIAYNCECHNHSSDKVHTQRFPLWWLCANFLIRNETQTREFCQRAVQWNFSCSSPARSRFPPESCLQYQVRYGPDQWLLHAGLDRPHSRASTFRSNGSNEAQ